MTSFHKKGSGQRISPKKFRTFIEHILLFVFIILLNFTFSFGTLNNISKKDCVFLTSKFWEHHKLYSLCKSIKLTLSQLVDSITTLNRIYRIICEHGVDVKYFQLKFEPFLFNTNLSAECWKKKELTESSRCYNIWKMFTEYT